MFKRLYGENKVIKENVGCLSFSLNAVGDVSVKRAEIHCQLNEPESVHIYITIYYYIVCVDRVTDVIWTTRGSVIRYEKFQFYTWKDN